MNKKNYNATPITEAEKHEILMKEFTLAEILQAHMSETCWLCHRPRQKHPYICDSCTRPEAIGFGEER